ncbi:transcription-repair coupling factor [Candidatus Doolittlea endobia]|uniref:Transcription-repair-coupling factor n=1 Tax=Candidatus Doolittlea endobia TaxID=1778262 RepID=A0A143WSM1_9ENTR|nr:transcription-repair coupling factor [Candidatus Doolittlea endobia]CUX96774.1 Transcription-repair-coupling factor [Candidatus Doolittlea endobia]
MSERNLYTLPTKAGQNLFLGCLTGAAVSVECASIVDRYAGPVLLITTDKKSTLRLHDEILQFTRLPVLTMPGWETLPYDNFSPHQKIISDRIATLYRLPLLTRGIIILSVNTLMQRVCPRSFFHHHTLLITKGQHLSLETLRAKLEQAGYRSADQILRYGNFVTHEALLDLYPIGAEEPYRIKFLNDKIESLCIFDVETQRTLQEVRSINLLPVNEFPIDKAAIELFRSQWREKFEECRDIEHIYQQVSKWTLPAGIEYWQPLFFSEPLVPLFDYLPANTLVVSIGNLEDIAGYFWKDVCARFDKHNVNPMRPLLVPTALWLQVDNLFAELQCWPRVHLSAQTLSEKVGHYNMDYQPLPDLAIETQSKASIDKLRRFCEQFNGLVIFSMENEGRREILKELLARVKMLPTLINRLEDAVEPGVYLAIGASKCGFINVSGALALICESDLFGKRVNRHRKENRHTIYTDTLLHNLTELHEGHPIVHLEHGVGRYAGMTTLETCGIKAEYLILIYEGNDKLYVPVSSLHLISRYAGGADEKAPLHRLGGTAWTRSRKKAAKQVRDVAAELLDISAKRAAKSGFAFRRNWENYQLFCRGFPFELTVDQSQAINAVLSDMCQPLVMDRLVCGDVGFGKTEVAMRAAFLAIENHKQVAILVPTTLLAQQHFDTFRDRFANWPIRIEMVSRFRSDKDQVQVLEQTAKGKVDILIGTHKLLQSEVQWHDLGLLIVDEEHRFGVRQKERIKAMHADIDSLTLTATPIPRTLNMAMNGMRDLSIIVTPPARRLAPKTFVREYDALIVREAILREVLRGGQVYYLYHDVENIEKAACRLKTLVPEAHIAIGHGQLHEHELERVMSDFYYQRFNVLVCTTIIETGIDISNANTIIIERADHFGLAQLHQLRGRVGRSHHQAYAYLLTPPPKELSLDALKKLEAITSLADLGVGFALATYDLEIRGAGELLGKNQSGQIETIGFSLYMELLESAIYALKSGREPSLNDLTRQLSEVEMRMPALLPEEYIPDVNTRLLLYKRIASAVDDREIEKQKIELIDRFGLLPDPARYLLEIAGLRQQAKNLGIRRIESNDKGGFIEFSDTNRIDLSYLTGLLMHESGTYRLDGPTRLKFIGDLSDYKTRLQYVDGLLRKLQKHTLSAQYE